MKTNKQQGNVFDRMKKARKKDGRNGRNNQFSNKIDEDKWHFADRDGDNTFNVSGKKKHKKQFGKFGNRGGEGGFNRGKGGKGKEKRQGKVKRMMQRNKKKSFTGSR